MSDIRQGMRALIEACPIQSPADRERSAIVADAGAALLDKVRAALDETAGQVAAALEATGLTDAPPLRDFFTAGLHQQLYCVLCGADPTTFAGGNARTAVALIRNAQQIARHHWGADIVPVSRPE